MHTHLNEKSPVCTNFTFVDTWICYNELATPPFIISITSIPLMRILSKENKNSRTENFFHQFYIILWLLAIEAASKNWFKVHFLGTRFYWWWLTFWRQMGFASWCHNRREYLLDLEKYKYEVNFLIFRLVFNWVATFMFKQVANKGRSEAPDEDKNKGESCLLPFAAVIHVEHFMFTEKVQILEHLQHISFLIRIFMPIPFGVLVWWLGRLPVILVSRALDYTMYGTGKYLQGCPIWWTIIHLRECAQGGMHSRT